MTETSHILVQHVPYYSLEEIELFRTYPAVNIVVRQIGKVELLPSVVPSDSVLVSNGETNNTQGTSS